MAGTRHEANTSSMLFNYTNWWLLGTILQGHLVAQRLPYCGWNDGHGSVSHPSAATFHSRHHTGEKHQHFLADNHQPSCSHPFSFLVFGGIFSLLDFLLDHLWCNEQQQLPSYALQAQYMVSSVSLPLAVWDNTPPFRMGGDSFCTCHQPPCMGCSWPLTLQGGTDATFANVKEHHNMEKQFENRFDSEDYKLLIVGKGTFAGRLTLQEMFKKLIKNNNDRSNGSSMSQIKARDKIL